MVLDLPTVRGRLTRDRALSDLSWLRVGGPAEVFFQPVDQMDLSQFLMRLDAEIPVFPIGVCSNLIVRDGGIPGVVIRLGRGFNHIEVSGDTVRAGAGALGAQVAKKAAAAGIDLAFLRTIPGSVGGAVRMNAGCYGSYTADVVQNAQIVTRQGKYRRPGVDELGFTYRSCALPDDTLVTEVLFRGPRAEPKAIKTKMEEALAKRAASQPVQDRSCGSTFRNPAGFSSTGQDDDVHDQKAWKLIQDAGMQGARIGGAQMSPKHANFMVNTGDATATDLESLGELVRERVFNHSGFTLEWEIKRVGKP